MSSFRTLRRTGIAIVAVALICAVDVPNSHAAVSVVPDPEFQKCLNTTYLHQTATAPITAAQLQAITGDVECQGASGSSVKIKAITGAEYLTAITSLDVSNQAISDLTPIAGLTKLTLLNLSTNQVTSITALSGLTALDSVDLSNNRITDWSPLKSLPVLTGLSAAGNQLTDATTVAGLVRLDWLDVSGNLINNVTPLASLTKLTGLSLRNNQITDVTPLKALTRLTDLDLAGNRLTSVAPLSILVNLSWLTLTDNQITDVTPLGTLTALELLDLTRNQITNVAPLAPLGQLRYLYLDGNRISNLTALSARPYALAKNNAYAFTALVQSVSLTANPGTCSWPITGLAGDAVTLSVVSGPATVNATARTVTYTGAGTVTLAWKSGIASSPWDECKGCEVAPVGANHGFAGTATVSVAGPTLGLPAYTLSVPAAAATATLPVTSNTSWQVTGMPTWLTASPSTAVNNANVTLSVQANPSVATRSTTLTFTTTMGTPAVTKSLTVTQTGAAPTLSLSSASWSPAAAASSTSVSVTSNTSWGVSSSASWLTASPGSGTGNGTVTLSVSANTAAASRSGTVTFTTAAGSPQLTKTIAITQAGVGITVSPSSWAAPPGGGSISVSVTAVSAWQVSGLPSWLSVSPSSGTGNATVTLTALANTSGAARSANVSFIVSATGQSAVVVVSQALSSTCPGSVAVSVSGSGTVGSVLTANPSSSPAASSWSYQWLRGGAVISGATAKTYTVVSADVGSSVSVKVTAVTAGCLVAPVTSVGVVVPRTLTVSWTSWSAPLAGGSGSPSVVSNTSWSVSSNASWVTVSPASGSGNGTVTVSAPSNTTGAPRYATLTFTTTSGGTPVTQTVSVSQGPLDDCGSSVSSYCTWSVLGSPVKGTIETAGDKDWFKIVAPTSGPYMFVASKPASNPLSDSYGTLYAADGTTVVASNDNYAGDSQFLVSASLTAGQTYFLEVRGFAANSAYLGNYTVTASTGVPSMLSIAYSGWGTKAAASSLSMSLTSNTTWSASSNASWLTVSPASGSGNGSVVLTVAQNTTTASRSAVATFKTTSGIPQIVTTITVTQQAPGV